MKINFDGIEYNVYFKYLRGFGHTHNKNGSPVHSFKAEYTECHIESLEKGIQIIATARKAPEEKQFVKEIGRKIAFTRALEKLFGNDSGKKNIFWNCYFEWTNQPEKVWNVTLLAQRTVTWR